MTEEKGRDVEFIKLFPMPSDFIGWLIDLNTVSHAIQSVDYTDDIRVNSPEVDNLLEKYLLFVIRNSDQILRTIEIVQPEIEEWRNLKKEFFKTHESD